MIFRKANPLIEVSRRAAIRDELEKLMTSVHEDSAWLRAGYPILQAEVTAGDVGKDHLSRGVGLLYSPKSLEEKSFQEIQDLLLNGVGWGPSVGKGSCLKSASQILLCYQSHRCGVHEGNEDRMGGD